MNILLEYLYRDAGNNKKWGNVVFSNKFNLDFFYLEKEIKDSLIDSEFFVAEDVGLPPLLFDHHDTQLDHGWHEYSSITKTPKNQKTKIFRFVTLVNL